jgi:hypothetical protein
MTLPVVFTANGPSGYNLTKSLRFRKSASAYMNRTPASNGTRTTWTFSTWFKRGQLGAGALIHAQDGGNTVSTEFNFASDDTLYFREYDGSGYSGYLQTTQVFRDPSAWYNIILVWDSNNATSGDRIRLYINGTRVTAFTTATYPSSGTTTIFDSANINRLGFPSTSTNDGYWAETNFIDGQALTPSSFGSTNSLTGVWQPAKYTGTYGTNGFYLPFTNTTSTSTLGNDFSGNSNNWTTNNLSLTAGTTYDSMTDVPTLTSATTANYAVINPLNTGGGTYSNGNLQWVSPATDLKSAQSTIALNTASTGKWYWEVTCVSKTGTNYQVMLTASSTSYNTNPWLQYRSSDGVVTINGSSVGTFSTFTTGDVIGVTFDASNSQVALYKNNTLVTTQTISNTSNTYIYAALGSDSSGGTMTYAMNFGQQPFTYTPPTGFVALNTYNLPTSTIVKGNTVMDATTFTANGTTQTVTNTAGFKPDLVWQKIRNTTGGNYVVDSVRGASLVLTTNDTSADSSSPNFVTSFNSNGWSLGTNNYLNGSSVVGWQWQAGQGTTSSNTSGSITSTVSVNASAGFSVVTYTGTGSAATVGHGLGVTPAMIIVKERSTTRDWPVWQSSLTGGQALFLNSNIATQSDTAIWNNTLPTSSVFSVATSTYTNQSTGTYVAYCWSEIAGFSKFGSYTGNGSTDGPFIYTGFRPKFILRKWTDGSNQWVLFDTSRDTYNVASKGLYPNASNAEETLYNLTDILSNGFKMRTTDNSVNGSGGNYIYMAFAENPFKNALAR